MERELILTINMKSTINTHKPVDDSFADERRTVQHAEPMTTFEERFEARTTDAPDFVDVTDHIAAAVTRSGIAHGRATVFAAHDACSIMVNERETGLFEDLKRAMARLGATNGNHPVGSTSVVLPIHDGALQLGTWQRVLLVELGEPSQRAIDVQIVGEG